MKVRAVLFDVDGTIMPFDGVIKHLQGACRHFGVRVLTKAEITRYAMGYKITESVPVMIPQTRKFIKKFVDYYHDEYDKDVRNIRPFPYVRSIFEYLKKRKIKAGLVTTKSRTQTSVTVKYYELPCDVIIGYEDARARKPSPEPVLKACIKLGLKPEDCILVGDHPFDMQAAKAAGCTGVGVLTGWGKKRNLRKAGADFVVKDIRSLKKLLR